MLLAADVGATKVSLGIFSRQSGPRSPLVAGDLPTTGYPSLEALVAEFLGGAGLDVDGAVIAVAGPVKDGRVETLGLPWPIDEEVLRTSIPVTQLLLLNDLEALARSVPLLEPDDLVTLREGRGREGGSIAVIAPGTGLGEAFMVRTEGGYVPCASEGGHASFAPTSEQQVDLLRTFWERFDHVSYETVCSGAALPGLYAFVRVADEMVEPAWLSEQLASSVDQTPVIVEAALSGRAGAEACVAAVELFVSILGAEAGNLALKVMATGGVYLGGGMPPRILPLLRPELLLESFGAKGPDFGYLEEIPVHVITNPSAGLIGAAWSGLENLPGMSVL
jgi:glucokinase